MLGAAVKIKSSTRGQTSVFRGDPCPNGHDGLRYVNTRQCVQCKRDRGKKAARTAASSKSLSDATRSQARWVAAFEENYAAVRAIGLKLVLSKEHHDSPLQKWVYRMRTRWDTHPPDRQKRLLKLGEMGWWLRSDAPRHQTRSGALAGSAAHKAHKQSVLKAWREKNADSLREKFRDYYRRSPDLRKKAAAARAARFKANPGLAAYLTSLRRKREQSQRCTCCTNQDFRRVYLANADAGLETDHKMSLAIALELGITGAHCVKNLRGLSPTEHRKKTSSDIARLAEIRREKGVGYHKAGGARRRAPSA